MESLLKNRISLTPGMYNCRKKKSGAYPVKYRLIYERKIVYYPSGNDLTLAEWDYLYHYDLWEQSEKPKIRPTKELKKIRELIDNGLKVIENHVQDLLKVGTFSIDALNKRMKEGRKDSVLAAMEAKVEELKKNDQIGTAVYYNSAKKGIKSFITHDIKFREVTPDWLRKYEKHLLTDGRNPTTVAMYMRALRTIMNTATADGTIKPSSYPFGKGKYQIQEGEGRKMALTLKQISKVMNHPLQNGVERRCRDLWYFSFLCNGINMNDLLRLKSDNIQSGEILFYRMKTINTTRKRKEIRVPILPEMKAIMNRWPGSGEYLFSGLEEAVTATDRLRIVQNITRLINKKMNDIGDKLGIGGISTYTARHSFATVLKRSGASIAYISESLGHTDLKTTANYLDSFEREERFKQAEKLTQSE